MMQETLLVIGGTIAVISLLLTVGQLLFGSGNKLANQFHNQTLKLHQFELDTNTKLEKLRNDFLMRSETHENNQNVGNERIVSNLHMLEKSILELRVMMGENYMRRDSYYKASDELKRDLKDRTDEIKEDIASIIGRIEDLSKAVMNRPT